MRWLTTRQQTIVLDAVDRQLLNQPKVETRNRKPMRPNPVAPWELRIGNLGCIMKWTMTQNPRLSCWRSVSRTGIESESEEKQSSYDQS